MSPKTDRASVVKYAFCAPKPAHIRGQKSFGTLRRWRFERFALAFRYLEHG
ncbi:hypothetical protein BOTBODRAFT_26083 [Botryobasidium botryosum FD-172 SS1]|uniref:Uncharacterized protein n=1 Tax=Botryobasidium botryosum (strain FD-172 SS1) TaxID=930990 RepID=A0A067N3V0_BOTB1|nr:hypothetical protein BOTBODRAFT_26083 [Botryobasidium botryosum FD-172 SS1]